MLNSSTPKTIVSVLSLEPFNVLDLLQKSIEFEIVKCSDQIETQTKAFASIAITFTQYTKDLDLANNMLDENALTS